MSKKLTTLEFILRATEAFGNFYDYSQTVYINAQTKVKIICPKHGEFYILPGKFLKDQGCPKCKKERLKEEKKISDTKIFIEKAEKVHLYKYDYSKTIYTGALNKLTIICPKHGEFTLQAASHLQGCGCPKCKNDSTRERCSSTTELFIEKAKKVHGNKYDYSKVEYKNNKTKVCIICPEHGEFLLTPSDHLSGCGCPQCSKYTRKESIEDILAKCSEIHNNKYTYDKVKFTGIKKDKVTITCPIHGDFMISLSEHLYGYGCPKCASNKKLTTEEFISKARLVHFDKYNYDKVNYINSDTKVTITCPIHGDFEQTPYHHLAGHGCAKCGFDLNAKLRAFTRDEWIDKAKLIHGNKYDYSKVNYVRSIDKVTIICPEHGEFEQVAESHITGCGCPKCNSSKGEREISKILEQLNIKYIPLYKISWSALEQNYVLIDFYLPDYNIFIEYNGEQHYRPIQFFGGLEGYEKQVIRDTLLREYCTSNNITLIEISYTENIEEKLKQYL